jgi:invasion protein IalB
MKHVRFPLAAAAVILLAGIASAAERQQAQPQPAPVQTPPAQTAAAQKPTEVKNFDNWVMRCFAVATPAPCDVFQLVTQQGSNQRVLSVSIAYAPKDDTYVGQIVVPFGVALENGLTIEAGKYSAKGLTFRRCSRDGCYVEGKLDPATVEALSVPIDKATLKIVSFEGRAIDLPLALKGFAAALAAMKDEARTKIR